MAAIFLSYSRDNEGLADVVAKDLMMLGHEVWFDRELSGGQVWWNQILTCRTERFSGIVLRVAVSGRDARQSRSGGRSLHVSSDPAESLHKLGLFRSISLTFAVVLFSSVAAQADSIVFSNLGPLDSYVNNTFNVVRGAAADPPFGAADQANDFAVGPTAYTFTSAQLALGFCGGILFGCFGTNQIDILLLADAGGLPGAVLQSIIVNNVPDIGYPTSGALLTVHAVAPLTLQANTKYWLGTTVHAADSYFPWFINITGDTGFAERLNGGPAWQSVEFTDAAFRISGDPQVAVPEPASLSLLGLGLVGVGLLARRRVRRNQQSKQ